MRGTAAHSETSASATPPKASRYRLRRVLVAAAAVIALAAGGLVELRREIWHSHEVAAESVVQLISRDIDRNIELLDLSLRGAAATSIDPEVTRLPSRLRQLILFDHAAAAQDLGSFKLFDPDGNLILEAGAGQPHAMNRSDRDFFTVHRDNPGVGLFVSKPFLSATTGDPVIAFSRRISRPGGEFAGVVMATLRLAYFQRLLAKVGRGDGGAINLFRRDGTLLMREPYDWRDIGRSIAGATTFHELTRQSAGSFTAQSAIDGAERYYAFQHLEHAPIIVDVAYSTRSITATWWRRAIVFGSLVVMLCAWLIALAVRADRQLQARQRAEAQLTAANDELGRLARTDPLTGLANRRVYDESLAREWRRAKRVGAPLSLLLIDVDRFKAYNDRYGHPKGDVALRQVAGCLAEQARRPGDTVCRIGGEEFAVILGDTDQEGAVQVAERMRGAVEALALPHADNAGGVVTISLGLERARPTFKVENDVHVAADAALYRAKNEGRNRVCTGQPEGTGLRVVA